MEEINKHKCCHGEDDCECQHEDCENHQCDCEECEETENEVYDKDGVNNHEHVLDMANEVDLLYQNIQDNTDSAFELLKSLSDEDEIDTLKIDCGQILEIEKQTAQIVENFRKMAVTIALADEKEFEKKLLCLQEYVDAITKSEKLSTTIYENIIKKFN